MRHGSYVVMVLAAAACTASAPSKSPAPIGASGPAPAAPNVAPAGPPSLPDSVTLERNRYVAQVRQQIAGKEQLPSSQVFRNVTVLGDVPAGRLLGIMNVGFGKSLGVSCTHCHVAGEWAKEDRTQKQTARAMWKMVATINNDLLKNIPNLEGPGPVVNCTTCHRGQVKPALNMP